MGTYDALGELVSVSVGSGLLVGGVETLGGAYFVGGIDKQNL